MNWDTDRRSVCGFPLAELSARPVPAEVLELQELYLRAAAGQTMYLAGKEVAPVDWFAEMSQLVALSRFVGPQEFPARDMLPGVFAQAWHEDHAGGKGQRSWLWRAHPPTPELAAALLHVLRVISSQPVAGPRLMARQADCLIMSASGAMRPKVRS